MQKIKATCAIFNPLTDTIISERFIGEYDTVDEASFDARKYRKDNECVCLYNVPVEDEEDMSALEMSEIEVAWDEVANSTY